MGCGICDSPDVPDYKGAAAAQGQANLSSAIASSNLSNPNVYNPYGSQIWTEGLATWDKDGNLVPGRPVLTQTLNPAEQEKLNLSNNAQQQSLQILNETMPMIRDRLVQPFGMTGEMQLDPELWKSGSIQRQYDFAGAPGMPQADAGVRDQVSNSIFQQGLNQIQPTFRQRQQDLDTMLANQGITRGSEAQTREQGSLDNAQQTQLNDLAMRAVQGGGDAMQQLFGMQMGARQQGVGEATAQGNLWNTAQNQAANQLLAGQTARNVARGQSFNEYTQNRTMPINMLNALISSSQVNNPQFQPYTATQVQPAPWLQAAQLQGQGNIDAYNAQAGLLGNLATAGARAYTSDRRLKRNIRRTGRWVSGLPLYEYTLKGRREIGVMADEVQGPFPHAVSVRPDGYLQVRYDLIGMPNGPEQR